MRGAQMAGVWSETGRLPLAGLTVIFLLATVTAAALCGAGVGCRGRDGAPTSREAQTADGDGTPGERAVADLTARLDQLLRKLNGN